MQKISLLISIFATLGYVNFCSAVVLSAFQFNQMVSCGDPLVLDESSILFLDEDIIIDQDCSLFELANSFSDSDTLTIVSDEGFSIKIAVDCNFGTVFFQGHQIVLQGNAQLVIMPGVSIFSDDTVIVFTQNSGIQWL